MKTLKVFLIFALMYTKTSAFGLEELKTLSSKEDVQESVISSQVMRNMIFSRSVDSFSRNVHTIRGGNPDKVLLNKIKNSSIIDMVTKATVLITSSRGWGSGVLLDKDTVVSNLHVAGRGEVEIYYDNKIKIKGKRLEPYPFSKGKTSRYSTRSDLALIKIDGDLPPNVSPIRIAKDKNSRSIDVFTIGHPSNGAHWTYLEGYIKNNPTVQTWKDRVSKNTYAGNLIEVSLNIEKGFSGGPIVDFKGNLHGINSHVEDGKSFGISFLEINHLIDKKMNFEDINFTENQRCGKTPVREENIVGRMLGENTIATKSYIDLNCDNQVDWWIYKPHNPEKPIVYFILSSLGKVEKIQYDYDRDGSYDFYRVDNNKDGRVNETDTLQRAKKISFIKFQ